ncbi:MAG TPA: c-type cytochrome, partial [Gaiellaceae bacterium]|nr:c-type cytochrome [Gaiellaceae bacterium]
MARRAALAALAVATAALVSGCGAVDHMSASEGDPSNGKTLFSQKCASCHVLADANAKGTIGPSLDAAFASVRLQKFDESTIRDVVRGQIAYPEEPMPAELVVGDDADDVAAYVGKCGGVPACGVEATAAKPPAETTTTAGGGGADARAEGKQIFTGSAGCGGCHALADAGTSGNVGPNLDEAKPSKALAVARVTNGKGPMPPFKGQLSPAQIQAVAAYVS